VTTSPGTVYQSASFRSTLLKRVRGAGFGNVVAATAALIGVGLLLAGFAAIIGVAALDAADISILVGLGLFGIGGGTLLFLILRAIRVTNPD
jgi:hypothetical protein